MMISIEPCWIVKWILKPIFLQKRNLHEDDRHAKTVIVQKV
jgi:hypothetical protein